MPVVPAPDQRHLTDDEVWAQMRHGAVDSDLHKQCVLTLELRNLQRQTAASQQLAVFTRALRTRRGRSWR